MRTLGKVLVLLVTVFGMLGLFAGGFAVAFWGFADQYAAHYTYKVAFKHPGDDCGNNDLAVDLADGEPLACAPGGIPAFGAKVKLPGFTDEQNAEVLELSKQLGAGGFTTAERGELQDAVNGIVASLPPDRLPQHPWFWGWKVCATGLLMLAIPVTVVYIIPRRNRRKPRRLYL